MSYKDPVDKKPRFVGLSAVVVLHLALVYALVNGLARQIVEIVQKPLETKIIEEVKPPPPDKPPPPPPPKLAAPPPPFIPPPEIRVDVPMAQNTITAVSNVKPAHEAAIPRPTGPVRASAHVDTKNCPKPEYPIAARRAQEQGVTGLLFLISADGHIVESKVERSSGSRRLDEAARAALTQCKARAAMVDGKPEQTWLRVEYEWKLVD